MKRGDIPNSPFDSTDIRWMQIGLFSKFLLNPVEKFAMFAHISTDRLKYFHSKQSSEI
jgi:hypothetical protein